MLRSMRHRFWWSCKYGCCTPRPSYIKDNQRAKEKREWSKALDNY